MHTDHLTDRTTCPCCGPSAPTVADALATMSADRIVATAKRLAFRPMYHPASRRAFLVEAATNDPVRSWCAHEARALAHEVFAGPCGAMLCFDTPGGTITFAGDELVAFAVALDQAADKLGAPRLDDDVARRHEARHPRAGAQPNRAARRANGRRMP